MAAAVRRQLSQQISCESVDSALAMEMELLQEIYCHELAVEFDENGRATHLQLLVEPSVGSEDTERYVCLTLHLQLPSDYPNASPSLWIRRPKGLNDAHVESIMEQARELAYQRVGSSCLYDLIELVKDSLTHNNKPSGSCSICLMNFEDDDSFFKTACYHYFHSACLASHAAHSTREASDDEETENGGRQGPRVLCPMCRLPLSLDKDALPAAPDYNSPSERISFKPSSDLVKQQQRMAELFDRQYKRGGIIDTSVNNTIQVFDLSQAPVLTRKYADTDEQKPVVSTIRESASECASSTGEASMEDDSEAATGKDRQPCAARDLQCGKAASKRVFSQERSAREQRGRRNGHSDSKHSQNHSSANQTHSQYGHGRSGRRHRQPDHRQNGAAPNVGHQEDRSKNSEGMSVHCHGNRRYESLAPCECHAAKERPCAQHKPGQTPGLKKQADESEDDLSEDLQEKARTSELCCPLPKASSHRDRHKAGESSRSGRQKARGLHQGDSKRNPHGQPRDDCRGRSSRRGGYAKGERPREQAKDKLQDTGRRHHGHKGETAQSEQVTKNSSRIPKELQESKKGSKIVFMSEDKVTKDSSQPGEVRSLKPPPGFSQQPPASRETAAQDHIRKDGQESCVLSGSRRGPPPGFIKKPQQL